MLRLQQNVAVGDLSRLLLVDSLLKENFTNSELSFFDILALRKLKRPCGEILQLILTTQEEPPGEADVTGTQEENEYGISEFIEISEGKVGGKGINYRY